MATSRARHGLVAMEADADVTAGAHQEARSQDVEATRLGSGIGIRAVPLPAPRVRASGGTYAVSDEAKARKSGQQIAFTRGPTRSVRSNSTMLAATRDFAVGASGGQAIITRKGEDLTEYRSPLFEAGMTAVWRGLRLRDGWRGPRSLAPTPHAANVAVELVRIMERVRLMPDRVLPTPEGGYALYVLSQEKIEDGSSARFGEIEVGRAGELGWAIEHRQPRSFTSGTIDGLSEVAAVVARIRTDVLGATGASAR
jgi:hypothetical protein